MSVREISVGEKEASSNCVRAEERLCSGGSFSVENSGEPPDPVGDDVCSVRRRRRDRWRQQWRTNEEEELRRFLQTERVLCVFLFLLIIIFLFFFFFCNKGRCVP